MFNRDYLEKLKQYVGKDIQLVESDNEVHIYLDSEIQYFLRKKEQKYILYVSERGKETEEKIYTSEVDMKRNFALWVKSNFSENIKYYQCRRTKNIDAAICRRKDVFHK